MRRLAPIVALVLTACAQPQSVFLCDCADELVTCDDAEFVQMVSGSYIRQEGGAPQVVGGIQGPVTAEMDVESGEFILRVTRQTGEEVTYRYRIDGTDTTTPTSWPL